MSPSPVGPPRSAPAAADRRRDSAPSKLPNRRNRGNRKRSTPARAARVSPRRLLEQARGALAAGDGRKALELIRQARDRDRGLPGLPLATFCASMQRARQLAAKGMEKEAAAMRAAAERHRASLSLPALSEADGAEYVRYLDGPDALAAYAEHVSKGPPLPQVERALADRLVVERFWDGLDVFDASHPLRRDAAAVTPGLDAMDAGDWTEAADRLQGVPRRSPFAAWRLFAKAMVCFGAGDDEGLRRTVERLPPDFALARTADACRRMADGGEGAGAPPELGGERARTAVLAADLKQALRQRKVRAVGTAIERLADAVYPEDPARARIDLLEIVGLAAARNAFALPATVQLVRRLLPADRVDRVAARILLLTQRVSSASWDPVPAARFLAELPAEFPRAEDQAIARACVLESLARTGRSAVHLQFLPPAMRKAVTVLIGRPLQTRELALVELMAASLAADPDNRDGYLFTLDLLRGWPYPKARPAKARVERVLEDMARQFPDDPTPWLELATHYYSKNAYRRAESALAEARERAPHDDRLLDLQAVGFLKSADQSRKNSRFALAERDLQRAEDLGRRLTDLVLPAKRLLLEIAAGGDGAAKTVGRRLKGLPPAEQLRTLGLLIHDVNENEHIRNVGPRTGTALRRMLARKAALIDKCGAEDVVRLLEPLPAALDVVYGDQQVARIFEDWWPELLARLDVERLPAAVDVLMDCEAWIEVQAAIENRLHGVEESRRDPLLLFYHAVLRRLTGRESGARSFIEIVDKADAATRERLRAAANRLARHARGRLRRALLTFDFQPLDTPSAAPGGAMPPIDDFLAAVAEELENLGVPADGPTAADLLLPGDPAWAEPAAAEPAAAKPAAAEPVTEDAAPAPGEARQESLFDQDLYNELDDLEKLIDDNGLRGASALELREVAGNMRSEPGTRRQLERVARECEAGGFRDTLTPEAEALLFPRARRKGR